MAQDATSLGIPFWFINALHFRMCLEVQGGSDFIS
jgi:hypothetical protein